MSEPIEWMQNLIDRWHQAGAPPSRINEAIAVKQTIEAQSTEGARYRQALNIIAGHEQCLNNCMSNIDIAIAALEGEPTLVSSPVSGRQRT